MKAVLILIFLLAARSAGFAQREPARFPDQGYHMIGAGNYVKAKNCYLLTLFDHLPGLGDLIGNDPVLATLTQQKRALLEQAAHQPLPALDALAETALFSEQEIRKVSLRLESLYADDNLLGKLVLNHLIPSGCYQLSTGRGNRALLSGAWEQDAHALNHMIRVYVAGEQPGYPRIDSISYHIRDKSYAELVSLNAGLALRQSAGRPMFYSASLIFALQGVEINGRGQAADDEPLEENVNRDALNYAKKLDWKKYRYTLILVPGEGPEDQDTPLSGGGMLRCRLAALNYLAGLAPLVMVSGGCVHPYKTRYNEAQEMKKYLIQVLHIPAKAILVEPHARHTTTNLRNASRIIFRSGFPMDKPCLVSTARNQLSYIAGDMAERCRKELGYIPYRSVKTLTSTEAEFYPLSIALQIDADEPMDP